MSDIDPEGFYRHPDPLCVCGPLYTYAGHIEPGGYAEDCPIHGNPKLFYDEMMRLRSGIEALATEWEYAVDEKNPLSSLGRALLMYGPNGLRDLLDPTEGDNDE